MNVSELVHGSRRNSQPHPQRSYQHHQPPDDFARRGSSTVLAINPQIQHPVSLDFSATHPHPPPSPPMDDPRCSLPSISDLFNSADIGSTSTSEQSARAQTRTARGQPQQTHQQAAGRGSSRGVLPPTPPLRHDTLMDSSQSPMSSHQYPGIAQNLAEGSQSMMLNRPTMGMSQPSYASQNQFPPQAYGRFGEPSGRPAEMYQQQPVPQGYGPAGVPGMAAGPAEPNPWQHHHYIAPSSQANFPPSQDRYICQTCNKAFSRPSSLRIHSHSHTGEKPFMCPQPGCGKAFSVRSNMKRHERGCHGSTPSPV